MTMADTRGAIQLTDVVLGFFALVAFLVLSPVFVAMTDLIVAEADGFSALVFGLVMPSLIIALILGIGVSARRAG